MDEAKVSEFLTLKSTQQQKDEGVEHPVDTAFVEERDGQLILKAVFDVKHFKPNEINVAIEGSRLVVKAQGEDDSDEAVYRKTMLRTLDLPEQADSQAMQASISAQTGLLTVEMPFRLRQKLMPSSPSVVPIITEDGQRKIRLQINIGPDFTVDDVKVNVDGKTLEVSANYEAEVGQSGAQVTRRELNRKFILPEYIDVESFRHALDSRGCLHIEVNIRNTPLHYRCHVTTEDVTGSLNKE